MQNSSLKKLTNFLFHSFQPNVAFHIENFVRKYEAIKFLSVVVTVSKFQGKSAFISPPVF